MAVITFCRNYLWPCLTSALSLSLSLSLALASAVPFPYSVFGPDVSSLEVSSPDLVIIASNAAGLI